MAAIAVAGVGLMVVCSSSLAAAMMMGGEEDTSATTTSAGPTTPVIKKYRYVRVGRTKEDSDHFLNLAEVEVFSGGVNVASGKTVTGSSLYSADFPYANLVDGNKGNLSHTNNEETEYFDIDLGKAYEIEKVVITNRVDCCQSRAQMIKIQLSASADMTSSKDSRAITTEEASSATFTWDVASDTLTAA
jgi:hypothetical protein